MVLMRPLCWTEPSALQPGIPILGTQYKVGLPWWLRDKESTCNAGRQETQVQSQDQEDPLEEGMATHSSILAWRIPGTEEPGRLQSIGCKESDMNEAS